MSLTMERLRWGIVGFGEVGMPQQMSRAASDFLAASFWSGLAARMNGAVPDNPDDVVQYLAQFYKGELS